MTTITSQAALLLALLPALVSRPFETRNDDPPRGKSDDQRFAGPMGREGVLEMLEGGMISTEEALDLLDGLDQSGPNQRSPDPGLDAEAVRRPGRPARPARPPRVARGARTREPDDETDDLDGPDDDRGTREERQARREERHARREERHARREAAVAADMGNAGFGGKRTFRIQVDDANGSRVNLSLPIGFLDTGLKVAERFSPGLLDGAVGNSIRRAIGGGQAGTIIEVDDPGGQHVRIAIE